MSEVFAPGLATTDRVGATAFHARGVGDPIVLLHGVGMNKAFWAPQIEDLARDCHVIACDLLGHGDSALPPAGAGLAAYGDAVLAVLDRLEIANANVVGHSLGALIAIDLALRHPQRVSRLVAMNAVYRRTPAQRAAVVARAEALARAGLGDGIDLILARWFGTDPAPEMRARVDTVRRWLQAVDPRGYACAYGIFATADEACAGRLAALAMPALFMTGGEDPNSTPEMTRRMAAEVPYGEALVVAGQRHMMSYAAPERVTPLLRAFLMRPLDGAGEPRPAAALTEGGEA